VMGSCGPQLQLFVQSMLYVYIPIRGEQNVFLVLQL
jgi:hypothetical protein